jgi:D-2-hydroxyglutarate dehydrogenase
LIGSEGTLGIVTEVDMLTVPILKEKKLLFMELKSYEHVLQVMESCKSIMGQLLVAFEYMDSEAYRKVSEDPNIKTPFNTNP